MTPSAKRQAIALLVTEHHLSVVRACQVVRLARAAWYRPLPDRLTRDAPVVEALTDVVAENGRWGFWKCYARLRLLGRQWNHKRVHRVYCALRLNRARRTKRRVPRRPRVPLSAPPSLNQTWALDFMRDTLYDSRVFRTLNVLDQGNREGLAIEIGFSLPSRRVVALLDQLVALHGAPTALRMDNGPEFLAAAVAAWAEAGGHRARLHPARQARAERLHRTVQPDLSHRSARREPLPVARRSPRHHRRLAATLQHRAAPRQPRPGAAAHVPPEANQHPSVHLCAVYLTGELTPRDRHRQATRRVIKGARWLLLRNRENLTRPGDRVRLRELNKANHALFVVYVLKDDLKQLWRFRYPAAARRFWRQWYRRALVSRLPPLVAFAQNLATRIDGVISHCRYPLHTGLLEGINNKIKVLKRMAYGFRDDAYFFLKIRPAFPGIP